MQGVLYTLHHIQSRGLLSHDSCWRSHSMKRKHKNKTMTEVKWLSKWGEGTCRVLEQKELSKTTKGDNHPFSIINYMIYICKRDEHDERTLSQLRHLC